MQHLLDFVCEYSLDPNLHLVVDAADGALTLSWQRDVGEDGVWRIRQRSNPERLELVHYGDLLDHLELLGVDSRVLERALRSVIASQVAHADTVLRDAERVLGLDAVKRIADQQLTAARELQAALVREAETSASIAVLPGGGAQTAARTGHLTLVR
jgi:hypothetical protein